jgi:hypothetical protein
MPLRRQRHTIKAKTEQKPNTGGDALSPLSLLPLDHKRFRAAAASKKIASSDPLRFDPHLNREKHYVQENLNIQDTSNNTKGLTKDYELGGRWRETATPCASLC